MTTTPSTNPTDPTGWYRIIDVIEATREIAHIPDWNNPSGALLGAMIHDALKGREIGDMTIRELDQICKAATKEYNRVYEQAKGGPQ